jgi:hypothetical protein
VAVIIDPGQCSSMIAVESVGGYGVVVEIMLVVSVIYPSGSSWILSWSAHDAYFP